MRDVNEATIIGTVSDPPEVGTYGQQGKTKVLVKVKTERQRGEQTFSTWHRVVCFGQSAEASRGLQPGAKVFVKGEISTRSFQGNDGNKRYITEISAFSIAQIVAQQPVSGGYGGQGGYGAPQGGHGGYNAPRGGYGGQQPQSGYQPYGQPGTGGYQAPQPAPQPSQPSQPAPAPKQQFNDDDIPF